MTVNPADPGRGDVAAILAASVQRVLKAAETREAHASVLAAIAGASPEVWTGLTREAFVAEASALAVELAELATRLDAEGDALSAYGRGVQAIKDEQRALELRRADAAADLAELQRHKRTADVEHMTAMALVAPSDAGERSAELAGYIAEAQDDIAGLNHQWQILISDRDAVNRACITALSGEEVLGSLAPSRMRGVTSGGGLIASLSPTDLAVLARTDPALFAKIAGTDPQKVNDWWTGLAAGERAALIHASPAIIGNLEGVAYSDRDTANRLWFDQQLKEVRDVLNDAQRFGAGSGVVGGYREEISIGDALTRLHGLEAVEKALTASERGAARFLISLTGDSPPLAAVSLGNLDTAANVTYAVPGMGSSALTLPDWAASAENVLRAQQFADSQREHAVVAWVGYLAPPVGGPQVLGTDYARAGADNLGAALGGFSATRPDASLNVLAHSYGTTTASIALTASDVHVSTFVSIGSAGLTPSIDQASDLHADNVFAGQAQDVWAVDPAPGDQWAWFGRAFSDHPVNPVGDSFGAQTFGVDSGVSGTAVTDHGVATEGGTGYLDANTESLWNVANATTGHGDLVTAAVDHEPTPFQEALIEGLSSAY